MFDYNLIHLNHRYFYLFGSIKLISNFFLFIRWSQFTFFFFAHFHFCSLAVEYKKLVLSLLKSNAYFPLHLCILYMFWVRTNLPSSFFFFAWTCVGVQMDFFLLAFCNGPLRPILLKISKDGSKGGTTCRMSKDGRRQDMFKLVDKIARRPKSFNLILALFMYLYGPQSQSSF